MSPAIWNPLNLAFFRICNFRHGWTIHTIKCLNVLLCSTVRFLGQESGLCYITGYYRSASMFLQEMESQRWAAVWFRALLRCLKRTLHDYIWINLYFCIWRKKYRQYLSTNTHFGVPLIHDPVCLTGEYVFVVSYIEIFKNMML